MAGSIADFKSSFKNDLARPNRFDVEIPIPLGIIPFIGSVDSARRLKMRCENAELPGRTISTMSMKIYGAEEKYPYQTIFNDLSLTFIVGDDMEEKKIFDTWINWINPTTNYNFKYKSDYAVPLRINQYTVSNEISYSVILLDAYPIAINDLSLDWSSDGYHKLTVTFAYTSWRNTTVGYAAMDLFEVTNLFRTNSLLPADLMAPSREVDSASLARPGEPGI